MKHRSKIESRVKSALCRIGVHTKTSVTAVGSKYCFNCGRAVGEVEGF